MNLKIDTEQALYQQIAREIESSSSPVGIDAKKTHIVILQLLLDIRERLERLEQGLV